MNIEYADNPKLPPGNGFLTFSGELFPEPPLFLSIQRSSDQKYLGSRGNQWLGEISRIPVVDYKAEQGKIIFPVGPAIVDSLDQKDQYRVSVSDASNDEPKTGRLKINSISHSMGHSQENTAKISEKPAAPETRKKPDNKPLSPEPLVMDSAQSEKITERKRSPWVYPVIILLCLLCLAWWYFTPKRENAAPQQAATSSLPAQSAPAGQTRQSNNSPLQNVERSVREFFAGSNLTPLNAMELAASLPANTPEEQDAIYRLYYYASTSANPEGLLDYGKCVDPSLPQWGTIEKNGAEAYQIYQRARESDGEKAQAAMEHLHKWLEEQAAAGNSNARAWLGSIKQ